MAFKTFTESRTLGDHLAYVTVMRYAPTNTIEVFAYSPAQLGDAEYATMYGDMVAAAKLGLEADLAFCGTTKTPSKGIGHLKQVCDNLLEQLVLALPYVETALEDQGYKPGAVDRRVKAIRAAISAAERVRNG